VNFQLFAAQLQWFVTRRIHLTGSGLSEQRICMDCWQKFEVLLISSYLLHHNYAVLKTLKSMRTALKKIWERVALARIQHWLYLLFLSLKL